MSEYIDKDAAVDEGYLQDWYINSVVGGAEPVWTEAHIEELANDFVVIPNDTPAADVAPVVHVAFTSITTRKRRRDERTEQLEAGVQCLLRAEIIRSHEKYTERGKCPIYAREALTRAYQAYHALGGNDVATDLYRDLMELPN